jgi:hypothetical protein
MTSVTVSAGQACQRLMKQCCIHPTAARNVVA